MRHHRIYDKIFTYMATQKISRSMYLKVGLFVILAIFAVSLFSIQIINHDKYLALAEQMQTSKRTINPVRGQIYTRDKNGEITPLVLNQTVFTVFADPTQINDAEKIRDTIQKNAPDQVIMNNLTDAKLIDDNNQYLVLARQVERSQVDKIRAENLAGVGFQSTVRRVYPEGNLAAQVLGFVNVDGKGQYGVEQFLNSELAGKPGLLQSVTDVRRIPLSIGANDVSIPAQDGMDYILTIDRSIQLQAEQILKNGLDKAGSGSGAVLVMNPQNGQILAMANYPTYNPAEYTEVKNGADFQNSTVSYAFEPGSVMKTLSTGTALDKGAITPDTTFHNTGCVKVDDATICNLSRGVDGQTMTMTEVLQWSLNTGAVWQLQQLGNGDITRDARQILFDYYTEHYRFGKKTGIEQFGEAVGTIQPPTTLNGARVVYANMTFGQGMTVTMTQFAAAFSAAINGGTYYQPTLIDGTLDRNGREKLNEPKVIKQDVLSAQASNELKQMVYESRHANNPNAYGGFYTGSKTGTAQVYDPATGTYSATVTTGTIIGFGADKEKTPQYVIMVRVDGGERQGSGTGATAQPIFDAMANYINQYEGISR